jgi:hypothetical protein
MGTLTKTLHGTDFVEWAAKTAELLRQRRFDDVDLDHVIEEIADLRTSQKASVQSQMQRLMMHLIKQRFQPDRAGWRRSIVGARRAIEIMVRDALDETNLAATANQLDIPANCPYTVSELLEGDLNSLWPRPR